MVLLTQGCVPCWRDQGLDRGDCPSVPSRAEVVEGQQLTGVKVRGEDLHGWLTVRCSTRAASVIGGPAYPDLGLFPASHCLPQVRTRELA
jgi:hypothetical protein